MNKEIFIERILVYYDIPQVFIAKDAIDTRYLCMYIGSQSDYDSYVGVQISQSRLFELFAGKIDLRTAYQAPEIQEYFDIHNAGDLRVVAMNSSIEDQYLPDEDFFTAIDLDDTIEREVLSLNKPVLHIGLEDGHSTPRADIKVLSRVLGEVDGIYSSACIRLGVPVAKRRLVAYVASAASYNIHMYADVEPDLFGQTEVDGVFEHISNLFQRTSVGDVSESLSEVKGVELSHYKSLIRVLKKNDLAMKYKYLTTQMDAPVVSHHIETQQIKDVAELLSLNDDDEVLNVEYMGSFAKVDATRTGLWTFDVEGEEGTVGTISGRVSDINILTGVVIKSERYRITCEQKTKSDAASIVGKNIYTLVGIERVE